MRDRCDAAEAGRRDMVSDTASMVSDITASDMVSDVVRCMVSDMDGDVRDMASDMDEDVRHPSGAGRRRIFPWRDCGERWRPFIGGSDFCSRCKMLAPEGLQAAAEQRRHSTVERRPGSFLVCVKTWDSIGRNTCGRGNSMPSQWHIGGRRNVIVAMLLTNCCQIACTCTDEDDDRMRGTPLGGVWEAGL